MSEPMLSRRKIERLRQIAANHGLTDEQAKQFGKLSATATWRSLLDSYGIKYDDSLLDTLLDNALDKP